MKKLTTIKINKNLRFTLKKATVIFLIVLLLIEQNAYFFPSTLHAQENASDSANLEEMLDIRRANTTANTDISPLASGSAKTDKNLLDDLVESPEVNRGLREKAIVQSLAKKSFQYKERILFKVYYAYDSDVEVVVKDNSGEEIPVQISESRLEDDTLRLSLSAPWKMKPGKYNLEVTDGEKVISHQEFTWGVLALNTDKSIYMFNETANFSIAVLDEKGEMVCDAKVELLVKDPLGNAKTLSSEKGDITTNDQCYSKELSLTPDYETQMKLDSIPGNYEVQLKAETKNGTYKVEDTFEMRELVDFDITRISSTRLFPTHYYPVELDIKVNADFKGRITEIIPENFEIIQSTSSAVLPFDKVEILSQEEMTSEKVLGGRALRLPFEDEHEVTLGFGQDILDPALRGRYKEYGVVAHDGTDFAATIGTPIYPLDAGTVILADENGDYGTTMVIQHEWGRSYYGHLSEFKKQLGDSVYKDDVIALSGNSGLSTGAHLHLGVKLNKNDNENGFFGKVDPSTLLGMESDGKVLGEAIAPDVNLRVVTWDVDVKRGDSLKLGYQFKAPSESPQFYRLGPLRMYDTDNSLAFQESRQWQLAIDASNYSGRHIKTIEYALGNTNTANSGSNGTLYSTDAGVGSTNGWTSSAPSAGTDGFIQQIEGTNIQIEDAWIEFRAQTTAAGSMSDLRIALSTCPGSVASCASAPAYRELPMLGNPNTVNYFINSGEYNIVYAKAQATAAFDGISDADWGTGVQSIMRVSATGPTLNNHTAKLILTYSSDFDASTHEEVKTVRFPLDSDVSGDTGSKRTAIAAGASQDFSYNAYIPDLASNSDIVDVYFEISAQISASVTSGSMYALVASGSPTASPSYPTWTSLGDTADAFNIFKPTVGADNFLPNTAQKLTIGTFTNPIQGAGGELVVTYKYSTDEPVQTETVSYFVTQNATNGSTSKNTATVAPVISNTGASVQNIYAKVQGTIGAARNLTVSGDIDSGGAATEKSNAYTFVFSGTEEIGTQRVFYDMSADAASFVSGGDMTISTQWSGTLGGPTLIELFITFTWDGDQGGEQTKSVQYFMESPKLGGTAATTAQRQKNINFELDFPETATKTLRSAYIENAIISSDTTTPVNVNMDINADSIVHNGSGFVSTANTGEGLSYFLMEDISASVDTSLTQQSLIFNYISDATTSFSPKAVVTYDVDFSESGTAVPEKQIKTVEYSFGNSNTTNRISGTTVYATDAGTGGTSAWDTTAPTQADQGITVKLEGTNIEVKQAWVEFRANATGASSTSDIDMRLSTCVASCTGAPVYRALPVVGSPSTVFYVVNTGETYLFEIKGDAVGAFEGISDLQWSTGVETILQFAHISSSINNHTAKLFLTYESDYKTVHHDEVKTVRFPLDSTNGTDTGSRTSVLVTGSTQSFDYNANIPDLDSNSDIYDVYFDIYSQTGSNANTLTARVVSGSQTNSPTYPSFGNVSITTQGNRYIFRPTVGTNNFEPNTAQQLSITAGGGDVYALGGELVVTYKYSTDEPVQTETVTYLASQQSAGAISSKATTTIAPVISNTGASVSNIYTRVVVHNTAASNLTLSGDIDDGGGTTEKSKTYGLTFGSEMIAATSIIYDMSADAASFVSGGNLSTSTQFSNTSGGPATVELVITFTWDGDEGGTQTKTVQYGMDSTRVGGTAVGNTQTTKNVPLALLFPETVTKTLRSAHVQNWINQSGTTSPVTINQEINAGTIVSNGAGHTAYINTAEGILIMGTEDATSFVDVAQSKQDLIFNQISNGMASYAPKALVTYDAAFSSGSVPNAATLNNVPFDNEKLSDTTPNFEFTGTDTDGNDLSYQIQVDDSYDFSSAVVDCTSGSSCATGGGSFTNTVDGGDTSPFSVEEKIRFTTTTALSNGTTYYWRVRAIDEDGNGSYSVINSLTIDTSLSISSWFQTTDEQFSTGALTDVEVSGSDSVELTGSGGGGLSEVQIDADVVGDYDEAYPPLMTVQVSSSNIYQFYVIDTGDTVYKKSTNGGASYGSEVFVADTDMVTIWYDKWTPGISTSRVHIWWHDADNFIGYRNLDTSTDTFSAEENIVSVGTGSGNFNGRKITGTISRGGKLYAYYWSQADGNTSGFFRSSDDGDTWSSATNLTEDEEDKYQLIPGADTDNNDIAVVFSDDSANQMAYKMYDDSANTWGSSKAIGSQVNIDFHDDMYSFSVAIRHSDNHAIVAYKFDRDTSSDDIKVSDLTLTAAGSATALTNVLTDTNEVGEVAVSINNNDDAVRVWYVRGGTYATSTDIYFKESTDDGSSWGSETKINTTTAGWKWLAADLGVAPGGTGGWQVVGFDNTASELFSFYSAPGASGTIMSSEVDYDWVTGATSWGSATFSTTETNGDVKVSLYYTQSTACDTVIPNAALSGNESGFDVSSSPIDLSGLNTTTYNRICMKATLTDSGGTPFLNDWSVGWTASELETPKLSQFMRHGAWFPLGTVEYETITARADGTADNAGSGDTEITLNKPSGIEDGDYMFMVIAANIAGLTLTDENVGTWDILHEVNETNVMHTWVLGRFADSEPSTWEFTISAGTAWGITVSTYTNVDIVSPEDTGSTYNYNITASTVSDCDSVTTVTDGAWNICVGTIDNGVSELSSGPAGYTQRVNTSTNNGRDIAVFDKEISSAGATGDQQINWAVASDDTGGFQFALRPASTSSGGAGIQPFTF